MVRRTACAPAAPGRENPDPLPEAVRFAKWHGLGNDYLLVERDDVGSPLDPPLVRRLCDYHFGIGSDGVIEVGVDANGPLLRVRRKGAGDWEVIDVGGETLQSGREPELSARRALNATEIIFACYESSR